MAQRTVHYLFSELISGQDTLSDKKRFLLGSILPDAIAPCYRDASHFKVITDTQVYYDFAAFRSQYLDHILRDDLYLGYYIHLVVDAFYRVFMYNGRIRRPRTPEQVAVLHMDYHRLNAYIVGKYGITNELGQSFPLEYEPIRNIAPFLTDEILADLAQDFTEQPQGKTVYLTEDLLDEFTQMYIPLALEETVRIKAGQSDLNPLDFAWRRGN